MEMKIGVGMSVGMFYLRAKDGYSTNALGGKGRALVSIMSQINSVLSPMPPILFLRIPRQSV